MLIACSHRSYVYDVLFQLSGVCKKLWPKAASAGKLLLQEFKIVYAVTTSNMFPGTLNANANPNPDPSPLVHVKL